jgi:hypothetical protein
MSLDEPTLEGLPNSLSDLLLAHPGSGYVQKGPDGCSHLNSISAGHFALFEPVPVELESSEAPRLGSGNYEVDLRGHEVREAIERESRFVGYRGLRAGSEAGHDKVLERRSWKAPEAIDSARSSEDVALFGVIGYQIAAKAQFTGLGSTEVASLAFGEFVETLAIGSHVATSCVQKT